MQRPPRNKGPHRHGGKPEYDFRRLKVRVRPVVDFSTNLNHFGPPRVVMEAWDGLAEEIARYPDPDARGVVRYYRRRFDLPAGCVLPGNGSTEQIYLVPRALGLRHVVVLTPSFHDYDRAARLAGGSRL